MMLLRALLVVGLGLWGGGAAAAEVNFPVKPVRWIAPFAPGGFSDILGRFVGQHLNEAWGQQVLVENRPGAGGTVAAEVVMRAPADGYMLFGGTISTHAINPVLRPKLGYDPVRDFAPVTMLAKQPSLLVAHPSLSVKGLKELVALAKRKPGELTLGTPGTGTSMHMTTELMKLLTGADLLHVPHKSGGAAMQDVVAGHVMLAVIGLAVVSPQVQAGKLRAIGVTGSTRSEALPDVPTLAEQGLKDFNVTSWHALFVAAGTPPPVIKRIHEATARILDRPENKKRFVSQGADLVSSTPEELAAFVREELDRWGKVAKAANIKLN